MLAFMVRLVAAFVLTSVATALAVGAVAGGISLVVVASIVPVVAIAAAVALRSKPIAVSPSVSPCPPPERQLAATIMARACPKCGGRIEWVAIFKKSWCPRCGRVRDR